METASQRSSAPRGDEVVLDRYRLVRRLGEGGFGVVWLAHDERLDRAVAVKRIPVADDSIAARAEREAIAAARLSHPGIVALYEAGRDEHAVYLVSELVRGRTLGDLMAAGSLSDRDVLRVGVALCDALAHAHGRGVIHRDVKPGNVIVPDAPQEGAGVIKLTDFGIARVLGDEALTLTGDVVGTLAYMAPEQAEGRPVSEATDLYAVALVLYEALTGTNPVRGNGVAATARRVGTRLPALGRMRRDLDPVLCEAIDAAVAPRPEERGGVGDLRAALACVLPHAGDEHGTIAGSPLEGLNALGPAPAVRPRPRIAAAVAATGLAAAALAWLGPEPPVQPVAGAAIAGFVVLLLPGPGWLVAAGGLLAWMLAAGATGLALIVAAAAGLTAVLLRSAPVTWSAPAAAPLLGWAGLACAWPALAAQAAGPWRRAALGALGFWWLALAEPLVDRDLLLGVAPGTAPRADWEGSMTRAAEDVVGPLLSGGGLAVAALWALGAMILPLVVRGRSAIVDLAAASAWAVLLATGTSALAESLRWSATGPQAHGLVAGTVAAVAVAVAVCAFRRAPT